MEFLLTAYDITFLQNKYSDRDEILRLLKVLEPHVNSTFSGLIGEIVSQTIESLNELTDEPVRYLVEESYQDGYDEGREDGYDYGYAHGRDEGYDEGYHVGYEAGQEIEGDI